MTWSRVLRSASCLVLLSGPGTVASGQPLPLFFEANHGQAEAPATFVARGPSFTVFLTPQGPWLASRTEVLRLVVEGDTPRSTLEGAEPRVGRVSYARGRAPSAWVTGIETFDRVRHAFPSEGVALEYHFSRGEFEYDVVVDPGVDLDEVVLRADGAASIHVADDGALVLMGTHGTWRQRPPVVFETRDGRMRELAGAYVVVDGNRFGFRVPGRDPGATLTIDPVVVYSTYYGGGAGAPPPPSGDDGARGVAVDAAGHAYLTGSTDSLTLPVPGAMQPASGGGRDAFVAKFAADGTLVYATYLGGAGDETGLAVAVDGAGQVYVTGDTTSSDFPVTGSAYQATLAGSADAFVARLDASGALAYSTYLGGAAFDSGRAIAAGASGQAYVAGVTQSFAFPLVAAFDTTWAGGSEAFAARVDTTAAGAGSLVYSTFIGGSRSEQTFAQNGIAVDAAGAAYVVGSTNSIDFPVTAGTYSTTCANCLAGEFSTDAFVTVLSSTGGLVYSTYFGGIGRDDATGVAVDGAGRIHLTGITTTPDLPTTPGTVGEVYRGGPYRSIDAGTTWVVANAGLPATDVRAFVRVPGSGALIAGTGSGLFRSVDGGLTWTDVNRDASPDTRLGVRGLAVDSASPLEVFVAMNSGSISKSTDGGLTWTWMGGSGTGLDANWAEIVAIGPASGADPQRVYAGMRGVNGGVYVSDDGGVSWTKRNTGIDAGDVYVSALAVSTSSPQIAYCAADGFGTFRTDDAGTSWTPADTGLPSRPVRLTVDPVNPDLVYAGLSGAGVYKTTNGGASWAPADTGLPSPLFVSDVTIDQTSPDIVYIATSRGLFRSPDGGASWASISAGLRNERAIGVFVDPADSSRLHAGSADGAKGFVARLVPAGAGAADLDYATYLGGTGDDRPWAIAADTSGRVVVAGETRSDDFPLAQPVQAVCGSGGPCTIDAFVAALDGPATSLLFSTYLGGGGGDAARGVALSGTDIFVAGQTSSSDFPLVNPSQAALAGFADAFVVRIDASGLTAPGGGVTVTPTDPTTGTAPVAVTFTTVLAPGETTVASSDTGTAPPARFALGSPAVYYDIATTATYAPPVEVCIGYAGVTFSGTPRLFHDESGAWIDRTTTVDTVAQVVCGEVTSLSPFALFAEAADTVPPALTVSLSPSVLWPPNHQMVTITATVEASDDSGATPEIQLVSIVSNEPDNGIGDGHTTHDIQDATFGTDDRMFKLRAERSGRGAGRIYTVTYLARDAAGNTTEARAVVVVPHSRR